MSETVAELAATDALLTALSRGDVGRTGDRYEAPDEAQKFAWTR